MNQIRKNIFKKEANKMDHTNSHRRELKLLDKGKTRPLGPIETLTMKYVGWMDGRKGLLRCNAEGVWQSGTLKEEVDAYEEYCARLFAVLKIEEEDTFRELNTLFDQIIPVRKKLFDAKERLNAAMSEEVDLTKRKDGEEDLSDVLVKARRTRELTEKLQPLHGDVNQFEKQLSTTVDNIFAHLSHIRERFDTTVKIANRLLQHCQRRVDVYWRTAMRHMSDLPALPNVKFGTESEKAFARHYDQVVERAEILRKELATETEVK